MDKGRGVTYPGQNWWILRVYDVNGVAYDVAKVFSSSKQIYRAYTASEYGYNPPDENLLMNFYHYYPAAWDWNTSSINLWPSSAGSGQNNRIWTTPSSICQNDETGPNEYGATINIQNNTHLWQNISGGLECDENPLF